MGLHDMMDPDDLGAAHENIRKNFVLETKRYVSFLQKYEPMFGPHKLEDWIDNFKSDLADQYVCYNIIRNLLFYNESDIRCLIRKLIDRLVSDIVLKDELEHGFGSSQHHLEHKWNTVISRMVFVPISLDDDVSQSSIKIARMISEIYTSRGVKVIDLEKILEDPNQISDFDTIVFIDDCIGTGCQLRKFRNKRGLFVENLGKKVVYAILIGDYDTISALKSDINIVCSEYITKDSMLFNKSSSCWQLGEYHEISQIVKEYGDTFGFDPKGFGDLSYPLIIDTYTPNWSSKILWTHDGWHGLSNTRGGGKADEQPF